MSEATLGRAPTCSSGNLQPEFCRDAGMGTRPPGVQVTRGRKSTGVGWEAGLTSQATANRFYPPPPGRSENGRGEVQQVMLWMHLVRLNFFKGGAE